MFFDTMQWMATRLAGLAVFLAGYAAVASTVAVR